MPELAPAAVEQYTQGRIDRDDPDAAAWLARGLAAARRWCGWHVTPERVGDVAVLDGPGARLLALPTLRLVEVTSVTENGTAVNIGQLDVSPRGLVQKRDRGWWTDRLGGITVTMTHGFDSAPDFEAAVLSWIDRASTGGRAQVIGPFQYDSGPAGLFSEAERALLEQYRLESPA